jgi:carbon-monoxide dehydrogenase large subunit
MVVAETALAALDGAELVAIDYDAQKPVDRCARGGPPERPQLWAEGAGQCGGRLAGTADDPKVNAREVDRVIASAKHVARVELRNQRLVVASMEPRGVTASYDPANDRTTLRACSQSAGGLRDNILGIMNWPKERLRVVTEDVGGAFGLKTSAYPEYIAVMVGARVVGRPVHWMSTLGGVLSDGQARDTY